MVLRNENFFISYVVSNIKKKIYINYSLSHTSTLNEVTSFLLNIILQILLFYITFLYNLKTKIFMFLTNVFVFFFKSLTFYPYLMQ